MSFNCRVNSWINPWLDPSGKSYQIVQSLLAVAAGGVFGRGPGLGNPSLVPVAQSDFIASAIAEEMGMIGIIALLGLTGLIDLSGLIHRPTRPQPIPALFGRRPDRLPGCPGHSHHRRKFARACR